MSYLAVGVGVELLRCEATDFATSDVGSIATTWFHSAVMLTLSGGLWLE